MYQQMLKSLGDKLLGTEYSYGPEVPEHLLLIVNEKMPLQDRDLADLTLTKCLNSVSPMATD